MNYEVNPEVLKLWKAQYEKLTPEQKAFIKYAADLLEEEVKKAEQQPPPLYCPGCVNCNGQGTEPDLGEVGKTVCPACLSQNRGPQIIGWAGLEAVFCSDEFHESADVLQERSSERFPRVTADAYWPNPEL